MSQLVGDVSANMEIEVISRKRKMKNIHDDDDYFQGGEQIVGRLMAKLFSNEIYSLEMDGIIFDFFFRGGCNWRILSVGMRSEEWTHA